MPERSSTTSSGSGFRQRPGRVLIIDDEFDVGQALCLLLSDENQVTAVTSAEEGLALLESGERYDVVLCDVMMPGMTGEDLYERLHAFRPTEAERVVFFTGGVTLPSVLAFFARIANLVLEKPPDVTALRELIRRRVRDSARPAGAARVAR